MIAIDCGYKDITKLLLEHKQLDINEKARNGHTPLSKYKIILQRVEISDTLFPQSSYELIHFILIRSPRLREDVW